MLGFIDLLSLLCPVWAGHGVLRCAECGLPVDYCSQCVLDALRSAAVTAERGPNRRKS
jgi:hypothetical protein